MPSTFFGLNTAYTGLLANNAALNTTSNNIANVQTPGYSRQHVVQEAANALRVFQTYGCAGAGVETLAIERIRDDFYDQKYWDNNTKTGEYEIKAYYMKQVETYFEDNGVDSGFKTIFDDFMLEAMQELLKDPSSDSAKAQFVGKADALAEYFNSLGGNMEALQKDINAELKLKTDEINSLASEIATLNKQINVIELSGSKANELRDKRTLLLDELSKIVDIECIETPIYDANQPDRETGANRFLIRLAGGQVLVDTAEYTGLYCKARELYEKVHQTDIDGLYEVYWDNGEKLNLYNPLLGGELYALVQLRDGNNNENFQGTITAVGTTEDGSQDTVTVSVENVYLKDLNKSNLSDQGGIINLGNHLYYYDSWEYNRAEDGSVTYTFTLSDAEKNGGKRVNEDRIYKEATIGKDIAYQGIPYYMNQMNEWVRTFSQKFNDIITSGVDTAGDAGNMLFVGDKTTDNDQYDFPAENRFDLGGAVTVTSEDDSYYQLTAMNFNVFTPIYNNASLLATKYSVSDGVEQVDLLKDLSNLATDKEAMTFRGSSCNEFLQCVLSDIALNANRANTFETNYTDIGKMIDNQRISISGVDEDEEAVNLVKYQNGYNLSSKMIQTLTEVYDRLILETGV
ncbi:MAG: flagellar hook-associated protein FlgK [Lachnospiraceae bacterium]|nr:flagellar hook-associated protein FlgK [Lachnospiraceae bacterium]